MRNYITAIFALASLASCDYSTSSNGNVDAAFARETKDVHTESHGAHESHEIHSANTVDSTHHAVSDEHHAEVPKESFPQDAYDTTAKEHIKEPVGKVVATDTIQLGKKGAKRGQKGDPKKPQAPVKSSH